MIRRKRTSYRWTIGSLLFALFAVRLIVAANTEAIESELDKTFTNEIESIVVGNQTIQIRGKVADGNRRWLIGSVVMDRPTHALPDVDNLIPIRPMSDGSFSLSVARSIHRDGRSYDQLTSRWRLVEDSPQGYQAGSHARYADLVNCRSPDLPAGRFRSKKGLGGWSHDRTSEATSELDELGIASVTVNVVLNQLVSTTPQPNHTPFTWQGRTYYANEPVLRRFDQSFVEADKRDIVVLAILLIANPAKTQNQDAKLLGHPDCEEKAMFAMPNVESPDGIEYFGAILNTMADRWSRRDSPHGRIHHWIMHNEVDAGREWTNAGEKAAAEYMDLYVRSMRMADLIVKQYDPQANICISLTHHWASPGKPEWYGSKKMLDLLCQFSRTQGDFPWGVAFHPYPQSLFNPRTWEDKQATHSIDTQKVTPKNLEVLDAYMHRAEMRYRGEVRPVYLSENGFNSKDYSDESLRNQAAGMAYAWKKIANLSSIRSWNYHNWIDNRHEGGLRIGLRKFIDDEQDRLGKKPIWFLFKSLDTLEEKDACHSYLHWIGAKSWESIIVPSHSYQKSY